MQCVARWASGLGLRFFDFCPARFLSGPNARDAGSTNLSLFPWRFGPRGTQQISQLLLKRLDFLLKVSRLPELAWRKLCNLVHAYTNLNPGRNKSRER